MYYFSTRHQSARECNETSRREIMDERHRYSSSTKSRGIASREEVKHCVYFKCVLLRVRCRRLIRQERYRKSESGTPAETIYVQFYAVPLVQARSNKSSDPCVLRVSSDTSRVSYFELYRVRDTLAGENYRCETPNPVYKWDLMGRRSGRFSQEALCYAATKQRTLRSHYDATDRQRARMPDLCRNTWPGRFKHGYPTDRSARNKLG